jgi:hypothetical protein
MPGADRAARGERSGQLLEHRSAATGVEVLAHRSTGGDDRPRLGVWSTIRRRRIRDGTCIGCTCRRLRLRFCVGGGGGGGRRRLFVHPVRDDVDVFPDLRRG